MFAEALLYLWRARLLLFFYPFSKLAPRLGEVMQESPVQPQPACFELVKQVQRSLKRASRLVPGKSLCLVQAFAGKMMLSRRAISCTIYLGLIKSEDPAPSSSGQSLDSLLSAHAWLRSGDTVVSGGDKVNLSAYTVISMFANVFNETEN